MSDDLLELRHDKIPREIRRAWPEIFRASPAEPKIFWGGGEGIRPIPPVVCLNCKKKFVPGREITFLCSPACEENLWAESWKFKK